MMEELRAKFREKFLVTARGRIARALTGLGGTPNPQSVGMELHSLAGEAAMLGYTALSDAARSANDSARAWADGADIKAQVSCARQIRTTARLLDEIASAPTPDAPDSGRGSQADAHRVLVVDDSELVRAELADSLGNAGFVVRAAPNADRAVASAREFSPHIVLLDVNIPGTTTASACNALRDVIGGVPLLLVSASHESELVDAVAAVGADGFVQKREGPDAVIARVRQALDGAP